MWYTKGNSQKPWNYHLEGGPLVVQASLAGCIFWEPICISVPAAMVVRSCIWVWWIFLKALSTCFPISRWVIYRCTCPHHTEWLAVFKQKWLPPVPHAPYSCDHAPSDYFFFASPDKKVLRGKSSDDVEEVKQKMAETLKFKHKIDKFKNFWAVGKKSS